VGRGGITPPAHPGHLTGPLQQLGALKRLAEVMGGIRGRRKAIVMFSEGIDYPIYDIFGSQAATTVMMPAARDSTPETCAAAVR